MPLEGPPLRSYRRATGQSYEAACPQLILPSCNAAYLIIPKTGCTSVKALLSKHFGWEIVGSVHNPESELFSHITYESLASSRFREGLRFCFVRSPFSRLFSTFKNKIKTRTDPRRFIDGVAPGLHRMGIRRNHDFAKFVELVTSTPPSECDPHVKPQAEFLFAESGECVVDRVLYFEAFETELISLLPEIGLGSVTSIPHGNRTQRTPSEYRSAFDAELLERVSDYYKEDIALLGYQPEEATLAALAR